MRKITLMLILIIALLVMVACSDESASDNNKSAKTGTGDEIKIRLGHTGNDLESDPYYVYAEKFNEVLDDETDGRIYVEVFPNAQLGDLDSMMEQVNNGNLEMTAGQNTGTLAAYDPNIQVLDLPYAFTSLDVGKTVLEGDFGTKLKESLAGESKLKLMSFFPSSFRHFGNNIKKVTTPDDLKGLTIRTMEVPVHQEMVKALGAIPQTVSFEELYSAVQTGVVDGHEQAPYTMLMAKLEEVTDYFTLDKHVMNTAVSLMNQDFIDGLSDSDQEVIIKAEKEAADALLNHVKENTEKDMEEIKDAGVEVNELTPEEFEEFQDVVIEPVSEYLIDRVDEGLVDDMLQSIEDAQ